MKLGLCQLPVVDSLPENLASMRAMVRDAASNGCDVVCLPEMWPCPYENAAFVRYAEPVGAQTWQAMRQTALESHVWLVGGSMPEREGDKLYNTCFVFSPDGEQIARHRKMHLFDIDVPGGQRFMESDTFTPGRDYTLFDTPFGKIGVAICFDVRFAELFRILALEGAKLVLLPGAFNMTTGPAHWALSLRMRALDNQIFTAGCAPARDEAASYISYGHSMICDPWGRVLASLEAEPGLLTQELDLGYADAIRDQIPILKNRRTDLYTLKYETEQESFA